MLFKVQLHRVALNNAFCPGPDSFCIPSYLHVSGLVAHCPSSARQKITQDSLSGVIAQVWWFQSA